jgi:Fe-S cluster biogenesis protein NfuA/nitrite reductase/ring-hydroxylating ferredoxin subunit
MMPKDGNGSNYQLPLDELITYLGELSAAFEEHPDEQTRQAAISLLQGLDALHRGALTRLTAFLNDQQAGHLLLEAAESDRMIATLLSLYDLLPAEITIRQAEAALGRVRPYIESHGGDLKVLDVAEGVVYVQMGGACQGCAGATYTLQRGIRQALEEGLPGFESVVVNETQAGSNLTSSAGLISLDQVYTPPVFLQGPDFRPTVDLEELPPGAMKQVQVDDKEVLIINDDGEIYAVGAMCPGSMLPLINGRLDKMTLMCGWHNEQFDIVSGVCLDKGGTRQKGRLPVYPIATKNGQIMVAVNVPARPPVMAPTPVLVEPQVLE